MTSCVVHLGALNLSGTRISLATALYVKDSLSAALERPPLLLQEGLSDTWTGANNGATVAHFEETIVTVTALNPPYTAQTLYKTKGPERRVMVLLT